MSALVPFEDVTLTVELDSAHEWLAPTADVAAGFGCDASAIRHAKVRHEDELVAGQHWVVTSRHTPGGLQPVTMWTKRGVVRLGMFIRSERAARFRDWAENLIVSAYEPSPIPAAGDVGLDALRALHQTTGAVLQLAEQAAADRIRIAHVEHAQAETAAMVEMLHAKVDRRHPDDDQLEPITPTTIGRALTPPVSGMAANRLLEDNGFQWRQNGLWTPSYDGRPYAVVRPIETESGRVHEQLLWQRRIIPVLERRMARRRSIEGAS